MRLPAFLLSLVFSPVFAQTGQPAQVVTDRDLLMTRQSYGEARIGKSVSGGSISIAGETYQNNGSGQCVGTHAVSMIPITVPSGASTLSGACGIDDGAGGEGSVEFAVLSGSEILWKSGTMKKGMTARDFRVTLPYGADKLYLLATEVDDANNDHANWVNLKWEKGPAKKADKPGRMIKASDYGMKPHVREDQTPALARAISAARANPGCTLEIPKGVYHFFREGALPMSFHISNHDQPALHPVSMPLVDLKNVTINGNGSLFLFHGLVLPVLVMDSSKVRINGISLDYERAYYSEATVTNASDEHTDVKVDKKAYPYEIRNNRFHFIGEGWTSGVSSAIIFQKGTGHILEGTADYGGTPHVTELSDGVLRLNWKLKEKGGASGDIITLRSWGRPHPAVCIYRAENTTLSNVSIHCSTGMALLAQRSKNIHISGGGTYPRKETGRAYSVSADATHFSNTKGLVLVENGVYKGMMDDAINVHSTCLSIEEITAPDTMRAVYKHGQSVGFEVFLPGETLRFIAGPTLEEGPLAKVKSVRKLNTTEVLITLEKNIPAGIKKGDAIENADYQPEVIFRNNTVGNNRARGSLFTTPKKVLVENNVFDHSSGSAILLAGDAQGWYESGACHEVIIRNNKFINNLTSRYQFTNAIISIFPEVKNLQEQKEYYHHNVLIENNEFQTFDVPLLFAISTEGITFRKNRITYNNAFKGWNQKPFQFKRCAGIKIQDNTVKPPRKWSLEDCQCELTPANEITF